MSFCFLETFLNMSSHAINEFSNSQSKFPLQNRGALENKRFNNAYTDEQNNKLATHKPQRISLTHFLANSPRVSTPVMPKTINMPHRPQLRVEEREQCMFPYLFGRR